MKEVSNSIRDDEANKLKKIFNLSDVIDEVRKTLEKISISRSRSKIKNNSLSTKLLDSDVEDAIELLGSPIGGRNPNDGL